MKTNKFLTNTQLADLLRNVAAAYQIESETKNKFRIIAYNKAADAIEHLTSEAKDMFDDNKLDEIPGVGESMATHIKEIFATGKSKHFDSLLSKINPAVFELMKVTGIGPKKAYRLTNEFNLPEKNPREKLLEAAQKGKIRTLEGFGEESEKDIIEALNEYKPGAKRLLLSEAQNIIEDILEWMGTCKAVVKISPLGSSRRKVATVGDIDFGVATNDNEAVLDHFTNYPKKIRVIEKGEHTSSILLPPNIQVDIMVQSPESFGSLLQHFTGSKHHNVALRELALKKNLSLSEYGIKDLKTNKLLKFDDEVAFYKKIGLSYIPPELRENKGEIQAALDNKVPQLVELKDIKGDLQMHSDYDIETSHDVGASSMLELCIAADKLGYEYIAVTEHNPSQSKHTQIQINDILSRKREYVDKLNYSLDKNNLNSVKKVFNSLEIDILPNGDLPVSQKGLETLDFALVSIHSSFKLKKEDMAKRVLSALAIDKVKIFAHPTARKINYRESVDLDWDKIFDFCLKNNKWIEINGEPSRLDLPDILVFEAVKKGVKLTMGTDAHHKDALANMKYAVSVAQRGWARKDDIINTRSLQDFTELLK